MAVASTEYTVFGFDSRLEWRPTMFIDGFPPTKLCSACGLVPSTVALLPCRHVLCQRCYDNCGDGVSNQCPLDKAVHQPKDVTWSTTTKDNLLQRKIKCWNWNNGCDALGPVREMVDHFEKDCWYHEVTCFRCKQTIAFKELASHLANSNCIMPEAKRASNMDGKRTLQEAARLIAQVIRQLRDNLSSLQTCCHETKELVAGQERASREQATAEMLLSESLQTLGEALKDSMSQIQVGAGTTAEELALMRNSTSGIMNMLVEVVVLVNGVKTSLDTCAKYTSEVVAGCRNLQEKLHDLTALSTEELAKNERRLESLERIIHERTNIELEIKECLKRLNERLNDDFRRDICVLGRYSKVALEVLLSTSEPFIWTVQQWSDLKKEAFLKGEAVAFAENAKYFYGYSILPGIVMKKVDGDQILHLTYHICQGGYDSLLTWPFQKKLYLHVLNAEGTEIPHKIGVNTSRVPLKAMEKPTTARSNALLSDGFIKISDIEGKRCVKDDEVSFKLKVFCL